MVWSLNKRSAIKIAVIVVAYMLLPVKPLLFADKSVGAIIIMINVLMPTTLIWYFSYRRIYDLRQQGKTYWLIPDVKSFVDYFVCKTENASWKSSIRLFLIYLTFILMGVVLALSPLRILSLNLVY